MENFTEMPTKPKAELFEMIDQRSRNGEFGVGFLYEELHPDFPAPVVDLGAGRCLLWRRQDIEAWAHIEDTVSEHVAVAGDNNPPHTVERAHCSFVHPRDARPSSPVAVGCTFGTPWRNAVTTWV